MTTAMKLERYIGAVAYRDQHSRRETLRRDFTNLIHSLTKQERSKHAMQWDDIIDYIIKH